MQVTKDALNLRALLAQLNRPFPPKEEPHWFGADGSTTEFTMPRGWVPHLVYVDGRLKRPGENEDYTIKRDVNTYTVEFAVAPPADVDVGVIGRLHQK